MGEIEFIWRRGLEGVRAWLIRSGLPLWLWLEALCAYFYVRNLLLTKALKGLSPYFRRFNIHPNLSELVAWGSLSYALVAAEIRDSKLESRARRCFFVSYDLHTKAKRFYDPVRKVVFMSIHARIFEGCYRGQETTLEQLQEVLDWEIGLREMKTPGGKVDVIPPEGDDEEGVTIPANFEGGGRFNNAPPLVRPISPVSPPEQQDDASIGRNAPRQEHLTRSKAGNAGFLGGIGGLQSCDEAPKDAGPRYPSRNRVQAVPAGQPTSQQPLADPPAAGEALFDTPEPSPEPESAQALFINAFAPLLRDSTLMSDEEEGSEYLLLKTWSSNPDEPSYRSVMKGPDRANWDPAISAEVASLRAMGCWDEELVELPQGMRAIPLEFVLVIKRDASGVIRAHKARLVARGDMQDEGTYGDTFAPTVKMASLRNMLAMLAQHSGTKRKPTGPAWKSGQLDVSSAYLHGVLSEVVYVKQVPGEDDGTGRVRRLRKTLYGLKQSGHEWNNVFHKVLEEIGFKRIDADPGVYHRRRGELELTLGIHVNDSAIVGNDDIPEVIADLNKHFIVKDLGPLKEFLGLEIDHDEVLGEVKFHQTGFAKRIVAKCNMQDSNPVATPCEPKGAQAAADPEAECDKTPLGQEYRAIIGMLLYLCISRADIAFGVNRSARYCVNPSDVAWAQVKRILRYINGTLSMGILYGQGGALNRINVMVDADHGADVATRRSVTGFVVMCAGGAVSFSSKLQASTAISSTEAEYMGLSSCAREVVWQRLWWEGVGRKQEGSTLINGNNQGSIILAQHGTNHNNTKHIVIHFHFVRQQNLAKEIKTVWIPTAEMIADVLTKGLDAVKHQKFSGEMGLTLHRAGASWK
ncbi:hypothetical protein P7C70_g7759, partial [Phenoliferia sp. Uapishka_3]